MTDHVLSDENGVKGLSVVHQKRVADKIRCHHRTPRPGFDRVLCARTMHLVDLLQKMRFDEGSFLQRSSHTLQMTTCSAPLSGACAMHPYRTESPWQTGPHLQNITLSACNLSSLK